MNNNKTILIIDLHSIMHHIKHGIGETTKLSHNDVHTFVIYGLLTKMRMLFTKFNYSIVVFACDSDSSLRKNIFPGYKNRNLNKTEKQLKLDELAYPQFDIIKQHVLPTIGFKNIFQFDGYEADDIIAQIVLKDYPLHYKIFITNDKDMFQCITPRSWMYRHDTMEIISEVDFVRMYGIPVDKWVRVKAYGGCSSDTVPGISVFDADGTPLKNKIGEKSALKYLRGELGKHTNIFKAFSHPNNKEIRERNKRLVILPFKDTPNICIVPNDLRKSGLIEISKEYNFKSILSDLDAYCSAFRLK